MREELVQEATYGEEVLETAAEEVVLSDAQIENWKNTWGKIYKTTVDGEVYIWRKLRRKEYVEVMSILSEEGEATRANVFHRQDNITKKVVLFPSDIESRIADNAGLATTIADEVILKSGFDVTTTEEL